MYLNINYLRSYVMTQSNFETKGQVNYAHWIMNTGNSIHDTLTSLSNNQASHTNKKKLEFNKFHHLLVCWRTWYKRYCSQKDLKTSQSGPCRCMYTFCFVLLQCLYTRQICILKCTTTKSIPCEHQHTYKQYKYK